jgi:hypothetical protein
MIDKLLQMIMNISSSLTENTDSLIPALRKLYEDILKYVCDKIDGLNVNAPSLRNIYLEIFKKIGNDTTLTTVPTENWLSWIKEMINKTVPEAGYQEVKDNFLFRIE